MEINKYDHKKQMHIDAYEIVTVLAIPVSLYSVLSIAKTVTLTPEKDCTLWWPSGAVVVCRFKCRFSSVDFGSNFSPLIFVLCFSRHCEKVRRLLINLTVSFCGLAPAVIAHAHYMLPCGECRAILFSTSEREETFFVGLLTMPPSKVCPQCEAVVPLRQKLCNSCKRVFCGKRIVEPIVHMQEQDKKCKASV